MRTQGVLLWQPKHYHTVDGRVAGQSAGRSVPRVYELSRCTASGLCGRASKMSGIVAWRTKPLLVLQRAGGRCLQRALRR